MVFALGGRVSISTRGSSLGVARAWRRPSLDRAFGRNKRSSRDGGGVRAAASGLRCHGLATGFPASLDGSRGGKYFASSLLGGRDFLLGRNPDGPRRFLLRRCRITETLGFSFFSLSDCGRRVADSAVVAPDKGNSVLWYWGLSGNSGNEL